MMESLLGFLVRNQQILIGLLALCAALLLVARDFVHDNLLATKRVVGNVEKLPADVGLAHWRTLSVGLSFRAWFTAWLKSRRAPPVIALITLGWSVAITEPIPKTIDLQCPAPIRS